MGASSVQRRKWQGLPWYAANPIRYLIAGSAAERSIEFDLSLEMTQQKLNMATPITLHTRIRYSTAGYKYLFHRYRVTLLCGVPQ